MINLTEFKEKPIQEMPESIEDAIELSIKHWKRARRYAQKAYRSEIKDEFILFQKLSREYCGLCSFWQDLEPNEYVLKEICAINCLGSIEEACFDITSSYQQVIDFIMEMNTPNFKKSNWRNILLDKIDDMVDCLKEYKKYITKKEEIDV